MARLLFSSFLQSLLVEIALPAGVLTGGCHGRQCKQRERGCAVRAASGNEVEVVTKRLRGQQSCLAGHKHAAVE